jgi:hypothetical protein
LIVFSRALANAIRVRSARPGTVEASNRPLIVFSRAWANAIRVRSAGPSTDRAARVTDPARKGNWLLQLLLEGLIRPLFPERTKGRVNSPRVPLRATTPLKVLKEGISRRKQLTARATGPTVTVISVGLFHPLLLVSLEAVHLRRASQGNTKRLSAASGSCRQALRRNTKRLFRRPGLTDRLVRDWR